MAIDQSVINFAVYEDKTEFMGIASVQLPDLTALSQQISGAGIAGNIEAIIPGHFEAMTCTINFRTTTTAALKLSEPRRHNLDIRVANQVEDPVAGKIAAQSVKHVLVVLRRHARSRIRCRRIRRIRRALLGHLCGWPEDPRDRPHELYLHHQWRRLSGRRAQGAWQVNI